MPHAKALLVPSRTSRAATPGRITPRQQVRHGLDPDGRTLHCGETSVPLEKVASYEVTGLSEKDLSTAFATIAVFSTVAALMTFGVLEIGWRTRFLFEGILFGAIGVCAVAELFSSRRQTLFTFELQLEDGRAVTFVTADAEQARRINRALDATHV